MNNEININETYPERLEGDTDGHAWVREGEINSYYSSMIYACSKCSVKTRFPISQIEKIKRIESGKGITWRSALSNHNYNCDNCLIQNVLE